MAKKSTVKIANVPATEGSTLSLKDFNGDYLVLYFYPKDNTSGCTLEGKDFAKNYSKFKKLKVDVWGVSKDSVISHEKFKEKMGFPFQLLSDVDGTVCDNFDVIKEKNMYGRKYMGIERSTFVVDKAGKIIKEWRKVKVPGHVEEVLAFVKGL